MIRFFRAELAWYYKRMRCRVLASHNDTCRARPDHYHRNGTYVGKHW